MSGEEKQSSASSIAESVEVEGVAGMLPLTLRIQKLAYFAVLMMLLTAVLLTGVSVSYLSWTLLIPIALAGWIWRIRTVVRADGLQAVRTFTRTDLPWDRIEGLRFAKWGPTRAVLTNGSTVPLPAVTFRDLPLMSVASSGRIPDPYATA